MRPDGEEECRFAALLDIGAFVGPAARARRRSLAPYSRVPRDHVDLREGATRLPGAYARKFCCSRWLGHRQLRFVLVVQAPPDVGLVSIEVDERFDRRLIQAGNGLCHVERAAAV